MNATVIPPSPLDLRRVTDDLGSVARRLGEHETYRTDAADLFAVVGILNSVAARLERRAATAADRRLCERHDAVHVAMTPGLAELRTFAKPELGVIALCPHCDGWTMFHADANGETGREWTEICRRAGDLIATGDHDSLRARMKNTCKEAERDANARKCGAAARTFRVTKDEDGFAVVDEVTALPEGARFDLIDGEFLGVAT